MLTFVQLLGNPAIRHEGDWHSFPIGLAAALCYHLIYEGTWKTREELAYLLWADIPEANARKNLRNLVGRIRKLAFVDSLEVEQSRIRWTVGTDVASFKEFVANKDYTKAIQTYKGDLLAGFHVDGALEFGEWLEAEREELRRLYQKTVLNHVEVLGAQELFAEAADALDPLRKADPFDELVLRQQLQNYHASGRVNLAFEEFEAFKAQLLTEFGAEPELATLELIASLKEAKVATPQRLRQTDEPAATKSLHNLPTQLTPFIGREIEQRRANEQLADPGCRLLTLIAPGGMGKTRLSLSIAREQLEHFKDGVYFVPFAAVGESEQIPYEIASALKLDLSGQEEPLVQVLTHLANKELLLVLDNLEHLASGLGFISELLEKTAALKILATSREQLNLRAEWLFNLGGLTFPQDDNWENVETYDSAKLFLNTAKRMQANTKTDSNYKKALSKICQLVEGMPLAIELAASWLNVLSVEEILKELGEDINLLETSTRDIPARHQSVKVVFDYSWALLTQEQQRVLSSLAIFQGGFEREAAQYITGASTRNLLELVGKSLLRRQVTGRFDLHPLVHQYAREKLLLFPGLHDEVIGKHSRYYIDLANAQFARLKQGDQKDALLTLDRDITNFKLAGSRAIQEQVFAGLIMFCDVMEIYHGQHNKLVEGDAYFKYLLGFLDEGQVSHFALLAGLWGNQAWSSYRLGDYNKANTLSRRAIDLLRQINDRQNLMQRLNTLAISNRRLGNLEVARVSLEEAIQLAREEDRQHLLAGYLQNLANLEADEGNAKKAESLYREALHLNQQLYNHRVVVSTLNNLGLLLLEQGKLEEGRKLQVEALDIATSMGFQQSIPHILNNLGRVNIGLKQYSEAQKSLEEALDIAKKSGDGYLKVVTLTNLAALAGKQANPMLAERLFREALQASTHDTPSQELIFTLKEIALYFLEHNKKMDAISLLSFILEFNATPPYEVGQIKALLKSLESDIPKKRFQEAAFLSKSFKFKGLVQALTFDEGDLNLDVVKLYSSVSKNELKR